MPTKSKPFNTEATVTAYRKAIDELGAAKTAAGKKRLNARARKLRDEWKAWQGVGEQNRR